MAADLNYLASHSRNLESILQSYRQLDLTIQSVLLVGGTFTLSRVLAAGSFGTALVMECLLVALILFSNLIMTRFQRVILTRGEDVNWWHHRIVQAELAVPPESHMFTRFKIYQSRGALSEEALSSFMEPDPIVSDSEIGVLLNADLTTIRRVINTYLIRGIQLIWLLILLLSAAGLGVQYLSLT